MTTKKKYDSTVARMAGNILGGAGALAPDWEDFHVVQAVRLARLIIKEVERTEEKVEASNG